MLILCSAVQLLSCVKAVCSSTESTYLQDAESYKARREEALFDQEKEGLVHVKIQQDSKRAKEEKTLHHFNMIV